MKDTNRRVQRNYFFFFWLTVKYKIQTEEHKEFSFFAFLGVANS